MNNKWIYLISLLIALVFGYYFYQKYKVAPSIHPLQLRLKDMSGAHVDLTIYKGKRVVLCFGASWCINCREELQVISKLTKEDLAEFEILVVSDESLEKIQRFKEKTAYPFTFLKLEPAFESSGINSIPTTYLLNKQLKVVKETVGYMNWTDASTIEHYKRIMD